MREPTPAEQSDATSPPSQSAKEVTDLPRPKVKRVWRPFPLVWVVPVLAGVAAGYYMYRQSRERGPEIAITFQDASGIREGETRLTYRGVDIGRVNGVRLTKGLETATVTAQLRRDTSDFAREGAVFWVVRPDISLSGVTGIGTVITGPYIAALPGTGSEVKEIRGREDGPPQDDDGLTIVMATDRLQRLQPGAPVYYRDIEIGTARSVRLADDATHVEVTLFIRKHYAPIVHRNSRFWMVSGADVKGGIFSGVQLKLGSIQQIVSGGVAIATPDEPSEPARDGDHFRMHDEPKKEWLEWAPRIALDAGGG